MDFGALIALITSNPIVQTVGGTLLSGWFLKNKTGKRIDNQVIPVVNTVLGGLVSPVTGLDPAVGALSGLAATGIHQLFKTISYKFDSANAKVKKVAKIAYDVTKPSPVTGE
jgi:hypothetical protein